MEQCISLNFVGYSVKFLLTLIFSLDLFCDFWMYSTYKYHITVCKAII